MDVFRSAVSILNLNLRFGLADDGPNRWDLRKATFPTLLAKYPADFLSFQEVNPFQAVYLQELLPGHGMIGLRHPAPEFWQNNILFHNRRWECLAEDHFFLSPTPDLPSRFRDSRWPRQCTIGKFRRGTRMLLFATTHFDFNASIQRAGARILLDRLQRHDRHGSLPIFLTGDFNAPIASSCYDFLTGKEGEFHDAFKKRREGTFHHFTGVPAGDRIDWMLYRGAVSVAGCMVVKERFDGRYPSDHFPLYAGFDWTASA